MSLKTRIIPTLLCKGRELVKGERFNPWRRVGNAISACRVHNMRGVDELCLLEVGGGMIDLETVKLLAGECFMPLSVGGGVKTLDDFGALIRGGADKVVLSSCPEIIPDAALRFGAQAVVYSLVYSLTDDRDDTVARAEWVARLGAGEIILQARGLDGTLAGYDLKTLEAVSKAVSIPVIASCGCGTYDHMADALAHGVHAVAAGAMFQFTDSTPQGAARYLRERGFNTRLDAA